MGPNRKAQNHGNAPSPDLLRSARKSTSPRKRREENEISFSRCDRIRVLFTPSQEILCFPEKGKRSAERRIVLPMSAISAACALFSTRPPFGAHASGTRHRLLPRWLSSRTGFPAGCCETAVSSASPAKVPRLSTLRADRSLCRSTGDPKPPGTKFSYGPVEKVLFLNML
jgi:hypothetical protein